MNLEFLKSTRRTFKYLACIAAIFTIGITLMLYIRNNNFYTCYTDDILQYYKMSEDFVLKLKTGNLSFYQFNNYLGASFYSDAYYVPIDFFTFFTTILSFVMNFELAFGITELFKLFMGTMIFAYYLKLRGSSNKGIFFASLVYLVCGYNVTMMAFSAFFSLVFYFPFAALLVAYFEKNRKSIVTIGVVAICFYNFYLAYTVLLFMALVFIVDYVIDHTLKTEREKLKNNEINSKKDFVIVNGKALGLYLWNMIKKGLECAGLMLLGVLISMVILLPSALFILEDIFPRSDKYKLWTFNDASMACTAIQQYMRILAEVFTPAQSTQFYAFNNNYITDHLSLYITITGLLITLYVFHLKDRKSNIFKICIFVEVIMLMIPAVYMLFSLSTAPYTRWYGILNFLNLAIMAHVISKVSFEIKLNRLSSIIRNVCLIALICYVLNFFSVKIFGIKMLAFMKNITDIDSLNVVWSTGSFEELKYDMIFMVVAIGIICLTTISQFQKKINILPLFLVGELILSAVFMFGTKFMFYDLNNYAYNKDVLNNYLNKYLPANNNFERIALETSASDQWGWDRSFTRTNLQLTDLKQFHSFYDQSANNFLKITYDQKSASAEERSSKFLIDGYSLFIHQLLGNRYVVTDLTYPLGVTPYHTELIEMNNGEFTTYELSTHYPFVVYNESRIKALFDNTAYGHMYGQQLLLNYVYYDGEGASGLQPDMEQRLDYAPYRTNYSKSGSDVKYDTFTEIDGVQYIGYHLTNQDWLTNESYLSKFPETGIMHYYYDQDGYGAYKVEFKNTLLEYADGTYEKTFGGYAYYNSDGTKGRPVTIWIENTGSVIELDNLAPDSPGSRHILTVEYADYDVYETFIERMSHYSNLSLTYLESGLSVSYDREVVEKNIIALPIAYNKDWKIDNKNCEIVSVNGGMLGVRVDSKSKSIKFNIIFEPKGLEISSYVSALGLIIFGGYVFISERKLRKHEENNDNCTVL